MSYLSDFVGSTSLVFLVLGTVALIDYIQCRKYR